MKKNRPLYRIRQFWQMSRAKPLSEDELSLAREILTPKQMGLFKVMHPAEQSHAIRVATKLLNLGETHPELLAAALLHDVGKVRFPLALWERALIVICNRFFPERVKEWSQGKPRGWGRPFVIAQQHPYWGARLAAESGSSTLTINLIWRHQERLSTVPTSDEDRLLRTLQAADDDS